MLHTRQFPRPVLPLLLHPAPNAPPQPPHLFPPSPTCHSGGEDDGFEERGVSEARSDHKRRLYTILDRQSLRRVQVWPLGSAALCLVDLW